MKKEVKTTEKIENSQEVERVTELAPVARGTLDNVSDKLAKLDKMKDSVPLTCTSKEFKANEKGNFIFLGIDKMNFKEVDKDTGEEYLRESKAVKFCDSQKNVYINAGVNLVEQLKELPIGTPISIEYVGKEQKTKKYKICLIS